MREGTNRLRIGALLLGVGLAFGVAAPAFAQSSELPNITVDDDGETTITTDEYLVIADDPSRIEAVDTRTPEEQFVGGFLDCAGDNGISECVEEVLIDIGLEEEDDEVEEDLTPYNPIDEGSIETTDEVELEFGPPGV
jgi:hypothetical protein